MKLNWNKSPFSIMKNWGIQSFYLHEDLVYGDHVEYTVKKCYDFISEIINGSYPIRYFTKTFTDVVRKNVNGLPKLRHTVDNLLSAHIVESDMVIFNRIDKDKSYHIVVLMDHIVELIETTIDDDFIYWEFMSQKDENDQSWKWYISGVLAYEIFIKNVDVETIILSDKKDGKVRIKLNGEKVLSQNGLPVQVIDKSFFRTVIGPGQSRRGHFKMQPHGPGLSLRKLIYISPYKTKGYRRDAGL